MITYTIEVEDDHRGHTGVTRKTKLSGEVTEPEKVATAMIHNEVNELMERLENGLRPQAHFNWPNLILSVLAGYGIMMLIWNLVGILK